MFLVTTLSMLFPYDLIFAHVVGTHSVWMLNPMSDSCRGKEHSWLRQTSGSLFTSYIVFMVWVPRI